MRRILNPPSEFEVSVQFTVTLAVLTFEKFSPTGAVGAVAPGVVTVAAAEFVCPAEFHAATMYV